MEIVPPLRPRLLLLALLAAAALCLSLTASAAADRTPWKASMAYCEDVAGAMSIDDAVHADYKPFTGMLTRGNRPNAVWLRIRVSDMPADHEPLVLQMSPTFLVDLQIYSPRPEGGWTVGYQGTRHAYSTQGHDTLEFSSLIAPPAGHVTDYYVRLVTDNSLVYPQVLSQADARQHDTTLHILLGVYLGLAAVLITASLIVWWNTRDLLWGVAALYDVSMIIHSVMSTGMFAKYVLPDAQDVMPTLFAFSAATSLLMSAQLSALLVATLKAPRWSVIGYRLVALPYLAWMGMAATGHLVLVLGLMNLSVVLITLWALPNMFLIKTQDTLLAWSYRFMTSANCAYVLYWMLPALKIGTPGPISLYPALPSNLFTMSMVALILARRTWLNVQSRHALELMTREQQQRLMQEQERHAETAGFLGMLMHEIKNPLTSIRMASELLSSGRVDGSAEQHRRFKNIQDSVDGIDTVLQRCLDMDRLERGALQIEKTSEDVALLAQCWVDQHTQAARIQTALPQSKVMQVDAPLYLLMLSNLISNALKYSPEGSMIELRSLDRADGLAIEVRNRAGRAGLPDPERLFEKYYRAPEAKRSSGTGLGLYWVRRVSEMLGGSVGYRSEDDHAVFTLVLPA